jgi:transposase
MEHYVGLDVSLKLTAICIVDRKGKIERRAGNHRGIAKSHAPHVARVGLETSGNMFGLFSLAPTPPSLVTPILLL